MKLGVLSSNYKHTAVEIREKLAVPQDQVKDLIAYLRRAAGLGEVMVLSTCNRVEIYFQAENPIKAVDQVEQAFFDFLGLEESVETGVHLVRFFGRDALNHIFRVTGSLESMVIGEPQITGQIKDFFLLSTEAGGCGFLLNQVFNRALLTAKRIRNETAIAKFAVSISFAAVELAKRIFDDLSDKTILIIGAGEMAELAVTHLLKAGCSHLLVTNRTFSRAVSLAEQFNGSAVRFEQMEKNLEAADIVISSTGAKGFVLSRSLIEGAMKRRKQQPMFLIDIAVPRDIDPEINQVSGAFVYDIDDLQNVVDTNRKEREKEAGKAQLIVEEELGQVDNWLATLEVVPTIKTFREEILALAQGELDKALSQMGELSDKQERVLRAAVHGLAYKILHQPTVKLKEAAMESNHKGQEYAGLICELFGLNPKEEKAPQKVFQLK
ncbi:MAG: glutamyl-tRNA reductase [Candidatus Lambdaproteobacteria bacterium RIFOXYD1_FULL_56_27]|uniref:Glutamyl-tRNA reductase n=1 Tax=Candidatus Lambdaproteobacteria bacterium RIFOXYD2_FULL_56_26 TaxID=1817773 RepID=A0A1F6H1Q1_9PROT|nr:MAG: glutamyl-tRNA reductase [Candidatus Lambdaproteobacteria bacterium RIFOXYD2_FULL_56_26]OGH05689.1 MAG: glutamyl-tRNA reductase [Candidatus Lambdaproteobacteria bacterium RIFOXYC1_FULL_56_13]OGH08444.1 MAG: glutamyl-tRNA reductase [Candidatus Lambdaproteobacteria bacterium RIFOXYD1_FULL_56_27]